jgi:hypothetical protein
MLLLLLGLVVSRLLLQMLTTTLLQTQLHLLHCMQERWGVCFECSSLQLSEPIPTDLWQQVQHPFGSTTTSTTCTSRIGCISSRRASSTSRCCWAVELCCSAVCPDGGKGSHPDKVGCC